MDRDLLWYFIYKKRNLKLQTFSFILYIRVECLKPITHLTENAFGY